MMRASGSVVEARGSPCFLTSALLVRPRRCRSASISPSLLERRLDPRLAAPAPPAPAPPGCAGSWRPDRPRSPASAAPPGACALLQFLVERLPAAERARPRRGAHPDPVLHHLVEIDHAGRRQRRHVLASSSRSSSSPMRHPEVGEPVIVHAHPAAQPAIGVVALAQPRQRPRAADPFARRIKPQRQIQAAGLPAPARACAPAPAPPPPARRDRAAPHRPRSPAPDAPPPIKPSMIHHPQFDLVAHRLAQPRPALPPAPPPSPSPANPRTIPPGHPDLPKRIADQPNHHAKPPAITPNQRFTRSEARARSASLEGSDAGRRASAGPLGPSWFEARFARTSP